MSTTIKPGSTTIKPGLLGLMAMTMAMSLSAYALTDQQLADIEKRIQPVGEVCLQGDADCGGAVVATGSAVRSGVDIYNAHCMACHSTGAAGAPKLGAVAMWAEIMQTRSMDMLYSNAINGVNAMPAMGLCMDCSQEEIKAAVDYMVENSQ